MRLRVRVNVMKPLKRKKTLTLSNDASVYVHFAYEKITLLCFLCGKLGHGESYFPIRALHLRQEFEFQLDISLRAQSKRNVAWRSRWLVEDGGDESSNYENPTNMYGGRNLRRSQSIPVDQGANVGFPPKISYSLKGKSNIS
ncbi:hypothetical protein Godav_002678 [Gossypium davidsonii]|uniref:Zinc knuckle CX2CX4HX4C domain-containing protein n=1 Tax=Gossypium davidsonii TaxID=34287 RepID=A0A7J8SXU0_GOSDV|nr:hypothetical protein [Gossypium davidsonii]